MGLDDSIQNLGVPIAARKSGKIKTSCDIMLKTSEKLQKIFNSELLISQMIHAVKMFVIPSLDFIIVNGQLKIEDIEKLDSMIRSLINKKVGRNILLAVKHGSWNDGGLSIPSIRNMGEVGKVKSLIRMLSNKDPDIRTLAEASIESEMHALNHNAFSIGKKISIILNIQKPIQLFKELEMLLKGLI